MTPLFFFLVLALIIGLASGILIGIFFANRRASLSTVAVSEDTQPQPVSAETGPVLEEAKQQNPGFHSILHLWRDEVSRDLAVDINGRFHAKPQTITHDQRKNLIHLSDEWRDWLCQPGDIALSSMPAPQPAGAAPGAEVQKLQPHPVLDSGPAPTLAAHAKQPMSPQKPLIPLIPTVETAGSKPVKESKPEDLSIVAQINEILQEMLKRSPLDNRGIRLMEDPSRGVIVWVGLDRYYGIDEVPMKDIKGILKAAVAEWERRSDLEHHTP